MSESYSNGAAHRKTVIADHLLNGSFSFGCLSLPLHFTYNTLEMLFSHKLSFHWQIYIIILTSISKLWCTQTRIQNSPRFHRHIGYSVCLRIKYLCLQHLPTFRYEVRAIDNPMQWKLFVNIFILHLVNIDDGYKLFAYTLHTRHNRIYKAKTNHYSMYRVVIESKGLSCIVKDNDE